MNLSEHFSFEEFCYSNTAASRGIDNTLPSYLIDNAKFFCYNILEPLRTFINRPLVISSGYRCTNLNNLVNGSKTSLHLVGRACDIPFVTNNINVSCISEFIKSHSFSVFDLEVIYHTTDYISSYVHIGLKSVKFK